LNLLNVALNRLEWGTQEETLGADLPAFSSRVAGAILKKLGIETPNAYDYPQNLSGSPEMAGSPLLSAAHGTFRRTADPDLFIQASRDLVEAFPDQFDAHVLRATALMDRYSIARTEENHERLLATISIMERLDPGNPYGPMQRASILALQGHHSAAVDIRTSLLDRSDLAPSMRAWVLRQRAVGLGRLGKTDAALSDLREAIRLDPSNYGNYYQLSVVLERAGRMEEALERGRQALSLSPDYRLHSGLVGTLALLGRWREAVPHASRSCDLANNQDACSKYAYVLYRADRKEEAVTAAREAASMPDMPYGAYDTAAVFALTGNHQESLSLLRCALDAGYKSMNLVRKADFDTLRGDPEFEHIVAEVKQRILADARDWASREPDSWEAQRDLGAALAALERWSEASRAYGAACQRASRQSVCAAYAIALLRAGQPDEARTAVEMAAGLEATSGGAYDLACYYALAGDRLAAIERLRRAVDLGYASDWISRDPDLAALHGNPEFEAIVAEVKKRIEGQ
jgi:tetratricopeptide (TPR) repeat protein